MKPRIAKVLHYVLPSIGAMFVTYFYVVVDGIFVGRGVGANALASVNLAVPFTEMITAVSSMLTVGGASVMAIQIGRRDSAKANKAFMTTLCLMLIVAALVTSIGVLFSHDLALFFGASSALLDDTSSYICWYSAFSIFLTISIFASAFVRNDGNPNLAFWGMLAGAAANVFLDWLFIFPLGMGVKGAAIASGLGQIISCLILALHFLKREGILRLRRSDICLSSGGLILRRGLPEFIIQMSQPVTIFCYNLVVLKFLGEQGLSAFSIVSYILTMLLGVFFGISQGIQPLIGQSYGEGNDEDTQFYFRVSMLLNLAFSALVYLGLVLFGRILIGIFSDELALIELSYSILKIYGLSFLPAAANIIFTTYFLSTERTGNAMIVSICRGFVLNTSLLFLAASIFDGAFIWQAMIAAEALSMLIGIIMKHHLDGQHGLALRESRERLAV